MVAFNYTGHIVIAIITALLVAPLPIGFIAIIIGALLPDIDHRKSKFGRHNPFACFMKHRGHCHSIIGILLLASPFLLAETKKISGTYVYEMLVIGEISHLLGDRVIKIW